MTINFNRQFKMFNGEDAPERIADIVGQCLFNYGNNTQVSAEAKYNAYKICTKLMQTPSSVNLTTEEATLVKEVCGQFLTAGAYGQVYELIENS